MNILCIIKLHKGRIGGCLLNSLSIYSRNRIHSPDRKSRGRTSVMIVGVLLILLLSAGCAAAAVTNLHVSPANPQVGDIVTIRGQASPDEVICATVTFSQNVSVLNGKYNYDFGEVSIPADTYCCITAKDVENLVMSTDLFGIPVSKTQEAHDCCANMTMSNIPVDLCCPLVLEGNAVGTDPVNITMTAQIDIEADENGNFEYLYETNNVPPGEFSVEVGNEIKVVTLSSEDGKGGGKGTGEAKIGGLQTQEELTAPEELPSVPENVSNVTEQIVPPETQPEPTVAPKSFMDNIWSVIESFLKWLGLD